MMHGVNYNYTYCEILENGNLLCGLDELEINVSGEKPIGGYIHIIDGNIIEGRTIYTENTLVFKDSVVGISEYKIGQEIVFNPGDKARTWNVIGESKDTVTLMLNENIKDSSGNYVKWGENEDEGPILAFQKLSEITKNWNNVDPIKDYIYINNNYNDSRITGYKGLEIKEGTTFITSFTGEINQIADTKARFASFDDLAIISKMTNSNLSYSKFIKAIEEIIESQNIEMSPKEFLKKI